MEQNAEDLLLKDDEDGAISEPKNFFDRKGFSSCSINFLFGAGVNGKAFPQMKDFIEAKTYLDSVSPNTANKPFEERLKEVNDDQQSEALKRFKAEFRKQNIDYSSEPISHIKDMLRGAYKLVSQAENRIESMKQINVFTLNYDTIIDACLESLGYLSNSICSSTVNKFDGLFDLVGYNFVLKKYVPSFLISRIHGDIDDPILPGVNKYNESLLRGHFEVIFKMKEKLLKPNTILIVIGYSGNDQHINTILKDCLEAGLTVYWFNFEKESSVPSELKNKVKEYFGDGKTDSTAFCSEAFEGLF